MATHYGFSHKGLRTRETVKSKIKAVKDYAYNEHTGYILGRDPEDIGKLVVFYGIFYACLLIFFTVLMAFAMYVVIDANEPLRTGMQNLQKENPGMSFRPLPDLWNPLIRFNQGVRSTYKIYTDHLQAFVDQYDNDKQEGEHFIDCENGRSSDNDDSVCRFNVDDLGAECTWQKDYGFDMGQPCILLKLNMQYGWEPTPYAEDSIPPEVLHTYNPNYMHVTCEGENPADRENIGNITFYPPFGFPVWYYPYKNQEGYRQPIVMARFENPMNGVVISVYCKAWTYNLHHHRNDQAASVQFFMLID